MAPWKSFIYMLIMVDFLSCITISAQSREGVYPGFLTQEVYQPYIEFYTDPQSQGYIPGSDRALIETILRLETCGVPWQTSRAGALGPGQFLLSTAKRIDPSLTKEDLLYDIGNDIRLIAIHTTDLTEQVRQHFEKKITHRRRVQPGSLREKALVLAAYNAGFLSVVKYGGVPRIRETMHYVKQGLKYYRLYHARNAKRQ